MSKLRFNYAWMALVGPYQEWRCPWRNASGRVELLEMRSLHNGWVVWP